MVDPKTADRRELLRSNSVVYGVVVTFVLAGGAIAVTGAQSLSGSLLVGAAIAGFAWGGALAWSIHPSVTRGEFSHGRVAIGAVVLAVPLTAATVAAGHFEEFGVLLTAIGCVLLVGALYSGLLQYTSA